jgi:hypothetical protein
MPGCAKREALMTEDVKFIRGNDRISRLAQRPDIAEGIARVRAKMPRSAAPTRWDWQPSGSLHVRSDVPVRPGITRYPQPAAG